MWIRKKRLWKKTPHTFILFFLGSQKSKKNKMWKRDVGTVERSSVVYVDKELLARRGNPTLEPVAFLFI